MLGSGGSSPSSDFLFPRFVVVGGDGAAIPRITSRGDAEEVVVVAKEEEGVVVVVVREY